MSGINSSSRQLWLLSFIPIISVVIFSYIPMFGVILAFKRYNYSGGIFGSPWCGFENFRYLLESDNFYRITRNTLVMNFLFIALGTAAVILALFLYRLTSLITAEMLDAIYRSCEEHKEIVL